jgi:hypothetical protein
MSRAHVLNSLHGRSPARLILIKQTPAQIGNGRKFDHRNKPFAPDPSNPARLICVNQASRTAQ